MLRLGLILLLYLSMPANAGTRFDIALPGSATAPHHWVVLLARPAGIGARTPGHAMVELGWEDEGVHATKHSAWGFYPENSDKGFSEVPGSVVDDLKSGGLAKQVVLVNVAVSTLSFDKAKALVEEWKSKPPQYHLVNGKNCIDFVDAIAKQIGLKTPDRSSFQLPTAYVEALGRAN